MTWTVTWRGRRGTFSHGLSLCVADVARTGLGDALGCGWGAAGRRTLCVAGVALGDMDCHLAWEAWHFLTWTVTLRGRRGTYGTG